MLSRSGRKGLAHHKIHPIRLGQPHAGIGIAAPDQPVGVIALQARAQEMRHLAAIDPPDLLRQRRTQALGHYESTDRIGNA